MSHWWGMHGYAGYIWPAYTLVLSVVTYNALRAWVRSKRIVKQLMQRLSGQ